MISKRIHKYHFCVCGKVCFHCRVQQALYVLWPDSSFRPAAYPGHIPKLHIHIYIYMAQSSCQCVAVSSCIQPPVTNCNTTVSLASDVTINTSMVPVLQVKKLSTTLCDLWTNTGVYQALIHRNLLAWLFLLYKT